METLYIGKCNFDEGTHAHAHTHTHTHTHKIAEIQQTLEQAAWCTGIETTKKSYQFKAFIKTNFNVGLQKFCCMCTPTPSPQAI